MKKFLFGIFAMIFAISVSAFSHHDISTADAGEKWFELIPNGDPSQQSDYNLFGNGSTAPNCTGTYVCAKLAQPDLMDPNKPNLGTVINTKYRATP